MLVGTSLEQRQRFLVSLYTLRKFYDGPVALLTNAPIEDWHPSDQVDVVSLRGLPETAEFRGYFHLKSCVYRLSPYDRTVFLDNDTFLLGSPLEAVMPTEGDRRITVTHNSGVNVGTFRTMRKAYRKEVDHGKWPLERWAAMVKANPPFVNTGVFGCSKDLECGPAWEAYTRQRADCYLKEEGALVYMIAEGLQVRLISDRYNRVACHHRNYRGTDTVVWHYCGGLVAPFSTEYCRAVAEMVEGDVYGFRKHWTGATTHMRP